jgi:SsrA-binding protein
MTPSDSTHKIAENKKAYHDYHIEERMEAGLELKGTEVKSVRQGRVNMGDSYATVQGGELWLIGLHISPYEQGNRFNHDPVRDRRLLMHKREIMRLYGAIRQQGMTLIPTRIYLKRGRVKVEIALARGKRSFDKRESEARKEANRAIERRLKNQRLGR